MTLTDKEHAAIRRQIADLYDSINRPQFAQHERKVADELDPPKPEFANGTVAWVTTDSGREMLRHLSFRHKGAWATCHGNRILTNVTSVEPLRFLGDDEIAVKRFEVAHPNLGRISGGTLRGGIEYGCDPKDSIIHLVGDLYADALDAELGDAK